MEEYSVGEDTLKRIRFLKDGKVFYGADQQWYPLERQRMSGCGPTAAATMFACISKDPLKLEKREDWIPLMQEWWDFITPGLLGVYAVKKFAFGASRFFLEHGLPHRVKALPYFVSKRPALDETVDFIKSGLEQNCPVAFLNLDNGKVKKLYPWHWAVITSLKTNARETSRFKNAVKRKSKDCARDPERTEQRAEGKKVLVTVFDADRRFEADLELWHKTAKRSGGFVYFATG